MTDLQKRIVLATDFSEASDEALAAAIDLARATGAELDILFVLERELSQSPLGLNYEGDGGVIAQVDLELSRRADLVESAGLRCMTKMVEGNPAAEIVKHARNISAAFIVVGTHGRKGLAHVLLGSVAERVVHRAACPVLIIPYSKKAA